MVEEIKDKNLFEKIKGLYQIIGFRAFASYLILGCLVVAIGITFLLAQNRQTISQQAAPKDNLNSPPRINNSKKPTPTTVAATVTPLPTVQASVTPTQVPPTPSPTNQPTPLPTLAMTPTQIPTATTIPTPTSDLSPTPTANVAKSADLNNDGKIDIQDLSFLLSRWGTNDSSADLNNDGTINTFDLSILLSNYGK